MKEDETLINKYRPQNLEEVVGQGDVVRSLKGVLAKKTSRTFLFVGESGTGKTSLARIVARMVGCENRNIYEINAASENGVNEMREIVEKLSYSALGASRSKMVIIDEAQRLSPQGWSVLLKPTEEPPKHVFWAFCSTDPGKIPAAIKTRCCGGGFSLKPVPADDILDLLKSVCEKEGWDTPEEVLFLLSQKAGGSPRQALSTLAQCSECTTRKAAAAMLHELEEESAEAYQLCQLLARGATWESAMKIVGKLTDVNPESTRQVVLNYFSKAVRDAKSDAIAQKGLAVLSAFSEPFPSSNGQYALLLALGQLLF